MLVKLLVASLVVVIVVAIVVVAMGRVRAKYSEATPAAIQQALEEWMAASGHRCIWSMLGMARDHVNMGLKSFTCQVLLSFFFCCDFVFAITWYCGYVFIDRHRFE